MRERRRYPRIPLHSAVQLSWPEEQSAYPIRDISIGGIFVLAEVAPPLGAQIAIELPLTGTFHLRASGVVVRDDTAQEAIDRRGFALEFDAQAVAGEPFRDAIVELLRRNGSDAPKPPPGQTTSDACQHLDAGGNLHCASAPMTGPLTVCPLHGRILVDPPDLPASDPNHALQAVARSYFSE